MSLLGPEASLRATLAAIAAQAGAHEEDVGAPKAQRYVLTLVWPNGEEMGLALPAVRAEELPGSGGLAVPCARSGCVRSHHAPQAKNPGNTCRGRAGPGW